MKNLKEISDRELSERIYVSQLRLQMEIETILQNVISIGKSISTDSDTDDNKNPHKWRHLDEIHKTMDVMYRTFLSHQKN